MAQISDYSIVAYERKPGYWRASIARKIRSRPVRGDQVLSTVTPDDYSTEAEARLAAEKLVKKL
jgi:hypothetical protein